MFKTEEKLKARLTELESLRYRTLSKFEELEICPDPDGDIAALPPEADNEGWTAVPLGQHWEGRDRYLWLRLSSVLPTAPPGFRLVGRFDFGTTPHGNSRGFESLLFVNGQPRQGVDSNHREVFLDDLADSEVHLHFRLWSGLEGGGPKTLQEHRLGQAEIALLHAASDDLYYTGRAMLETADILADTRAERGDLLLALDRSFRLLDWSKPGSESFYVSVETALAELERRLGKLRADYPQSADPITVNCIGHTHIDVAWLWRLRHTREKAARSFSTVLELMKHYPDYVFLQTQPQLYEYVKQDYPRLYEEIAKKVAEGRWEAGGAMWLEADCNLSSGESLVRQILHGTRFFRDEFGVENRYLWLPDVFGYSWALPQILRKSGITSFMTTKISWSQYNRMPHDTFVWRGIDGSEVLTHFITTPEIEFPEETYYTYNGYIVPKTVQGIWEQYKDREMNRELLLCYGYGDGGGGVNRDMLEMRRRLEHMPGLPRTVTGRADDYFDRLERTAAETEGYVHTWDGELYLENHRGTYTSQAWIKKANRRLELALRRSELLNAAAGLLGGHDAPAGQQRLDQAWKIALRNQFHDIIPGSSIGEVYEDARLEYEEANSLVASVDEASVQALTSTEKRSEEDEPYHTYTVFNDSSWSSSEPVEIRGWDTHEQPSEQEERSIIEVAGCSWRTADGRQLAFQRTEKGWLVDTGDVVPLGFTELIFDPEGDPSEASESTDRIEPARSIASEPEFIWQENRLETPFYIVEWDEQGGLSRLYDREHRREVLASGERGNVFQVFEDKPLQFDAWNIDLFYKEKMRTVDTLRFMRLKENGPLRVSIEMEWAYGDSLITQEMRLYTGHRRIDFCTTVDWQERRQLLKVAFPVAIRATEASYDIQFGNVKRPTHWNTSWDYARFETVGHQWADLSERGYGVSLLNDCKYGYDVKDHTLRLSLIKSAEYPDPEADLGEHVFTYSLFPHAGDWAEGGTIRQAWNLNSPPVAWEGRSSLHGRSLLHATGLNGSDSRAAIDAFKAAEDGNGWIVRLHECEGRSGEAEMSSFAGPLRWQETDLLERPIGEEQSGVWQFTLKPYEIKTFRLNFGGGVSDE
ncbi:alpha-mannosidase [Saccharibacillus sacchari]|uniref:alpha-mannosidase n=1 Tax=Saccharibacillus sacchari TaxID=456493 RepID=UPI0004B0DE41|nr:alpha-mannosidase [Saccharibacillus sacchari]